MTRTDEEINGPKQNKLRAGLVILPSCKQKLQEIQNQYYKTPYGWLFKHHVVDLRESKAPVQELIRAITGEAWEVDDLSSKGDVDYTRLRDLLKAENWKKAHQETVDVMSEAAGREQDFGLDIQSIKNFPCTDLRTIDQLWVKYSGGRFGFSVQNRIWESVGKDYEKFALRVGWRYGKPFSPSLGLKSFMARPSTMLLTFSTNVPQGHLPCVIGTASFGGEAVWVGSEFSALASRLVNCNI
ncbi:GUN4 domain-containing protein [Brasilonema sp. CT11]|nr:GUN4 domain-containing protein [Brasilonema sp. CT11]